MPITSIHAAGAMVWIRLKGWGPAPEAANQLDTVQQAIHWANNSTDRAAPWDPPSGRKMRRTLKKAATALANNQRPPIRYQCCSVSRLLVQLLRDGLP